MEQKAETARKTIVVANQDGLETEAIRQEIGETYGVHAITAPAEFPTYAANCDLILLDANFTEKHGVDFLTGVLSLRQLPVLIITPVEQPQWAVEAVRAGAINYLVKTTTYRALLNHTIKDAIERFEEREELKRIRAKLQGRPSDLEQQSSPPGKNVAEAVAREKADPRGIRSSLLEEITKQLRKGEITVPSYPEINVKLRRLMTDQADIADIARLLRNDPAISSKLMIAANSARFGGGREIKTVEQAITRLGMNETRLHVEVISNRSLYTMRNEKYQPLVTRLWEHSMACAHASQIISRLTLVGIPDEVFTVALLHDIGKLLLIQIIADLEFKGLVMKEPGTDVPHAFMAEHHGRFGKSVLDRWRFPEVYGQVALSHDAPEIPDASAPELLLVHFANLLVKKMGYSMEPAQEIDLAASKSAKRLRLGADEIARLSDEVKTVVEESKSAI